MIVNEYPVAAVAICSLYSNSVQPKNPKSESTGVISRSKSIMSFFDQLLSMCLSSRIWDLNLNPGALHGFTRSENFNQGIA